CQTVGSSATLTAPATKTAGYDPIKAMGTSAAKSASQPVRSGRLSQWTAGKIKTSAKNRSKLYGLTTAPIVTGQRATARKPTPSASNINPIRIIMIVERTSSDRCRSACGEGNIRVLVEATTVAMKELLFLASSTSRM